jgi:hypothetical protein
LPTKDLLASTLGEASHKALTKPGAISTLAGG